MFRLLLMVGGSSLALGFATTAFALTAPPPALDGASSAVIQVGDMEEKEKELAEDPENQVREEIDDPDAEATMPDDTPAEAKEPGPGEQEEIDEEEGKN